MRQEALQTLFEYVTRMLPRAYVTMLNPQGRPVFSNPSEEPLSLPQSSVELYFDPVTASYLQTVPLSGGWTLMIKDMVKSRDMALERSRMVQAIQALIVGRDDLMEQAGFTRNNMILLANQLFHLTTPDSTAYLVLWGLEIGFDLSLQRAVCVLELPSVGAKNAVLQDKVQRLIHNELTSYRLRADDSNPVFSPGSVAMQDIVAPMSSSQLVVLMVIPQKRDNVRHELQAFLLSIHHALHVDLGIYVRIGVGAVPETLTEYGVSLAQAQSALNYAKLFESTAAVSFIDDFLFEQEVAHLPQETILHFLGASAKKLVSSQLLETVQALIRCNMNIEQAAQMLFVHRNTVVFRLNQMKKMLGLNPLHCDEDRFTLRMIYICCMLYLTPRKARESPAK